ncbi:MAG: class I poly(R)-hydroxyalkanoic acid synthase [Proteobacteria bacterium]|nr:class I poly(R)-hydroxyalkanoic acid synthase [Pseudomonadota bacterium]MDA1070080.1 class I poly(R)-hydroxyalkanoic acid synthase [Pseudomonadota bacterium]
MTSEPTVPTDPADIPVISPEEWQEVAERSHKVMQEFLANQGNGPSPMDDMARMAGIFMKGMGQLMADPARLIEAQTSLWHNYFDLWQATARRMAGQESAPVVEPAADDKRFRDEAWSENAVFDYMKQSYLLSANWIQGLMGGVEGLDKKTKHQLDFYTKLYVDALSPTNFAATNPEVLRATAETKGENLVKGLKNLLEDFERGKGKLAIKMVDRDAFEVGGNLAVTPGKVVFQNDLMQLIQYTPTTQKVHKRPLLIVPPWINKYYILDLKPANSFIRWVVEQGYTVFVVSWVNPDGEMAKKTFEDYMLEGPVAVLGAIEQATGEKKINAVGYCIGGTLLAATLAYLAARKDDRVAAATFLTTLVDFEQVGDVGVFIDEAQVQAIEEMMNKRGFLDGSEMSATFNTLRANDLVWSFVINNYLLGKEPFPFDILYWNGDSTRMPAVMHSQYLRHMYLENALSKPGGITLGGAALDLRKIKQPTYILSTREDHIAPWESTYRATQFYAGDVTFTLAMSGHVAGVVNPPAKGKYGYWTNDSLPPSSADWLAGAEKHDGSWWPHWEAWLKQHAGAMVAARMPGKGGKLKAIEDAPGSYVKAQLREPA